MDQFHLLFAVFQALGLCGICHFIADGIKDHARMVVILLHHLCSIFCPMFLKIQAVIEFCLAVKPHVKTLIHHVHTVMIAGFQHGAAAGIMGRANGIKTGFLQDPHSAPFTFIIGRSAQNAIVMVHAAAPQKGFLAVDEQALGTPLNFPDAEFFFHGITSHSDSAGVQMGRFVAPKLGIGDGDLAASTAAHGNDGAAVQNFYGNIGSCIGLHPDHCRFHGQGGDLHAPVFHPRLITNMQPNRAVNTGTGIPAGVGQLGIIGHHGQDIFLAVFQILQRQPKAGIAIAVATDFFAVQRNSAIFVDTLKFDQHLLICPFGRHCEGLFISINAAGEIAMTAVGCGSRPGFGNLRVMGQGHRCAVAAPIIYKAYFLHNSLLFLIS